jgi:hypothetical protein
MEVIVAIKGFASQSHWLHFLKHASGFHGYISLWAWKLVDFQSFPVCGVLVWRGFDELLLFKEPYRLSKMLLLRILGQLKADFSTTLVYVIMDDCECKMKRDLEQSCHIVSVCINP